MNSKHNSPRTLSGKRRSIFTTATLLTLLSGPATATTTFEALIGTWRGEGRVVFDGGKAEKLSCNTYYVQKESGKRLNLVIRCANPSSGKIEMRGTLDHIDGKLNGTWEERTYNATGTANGGISSNQIHLSFKGAVNGTLTTLLLNDTQSIFIRSQGSGLSTINIMLKKTAGTP